MLKKIDCVFWFIFHVQKKYLFFEKEKKVRKTFFERSSELGWQKKKWQKKKGTTTTTTTTRRVPPILYLVKLFTFLSKFLPSFPLFNLQKLFRMFSTSKIYPKDLLRKQFSQKKVFLNKKIIHFFFDFFFLWIFFFDFFFFVQNLLETFFFDFTVIHFLPTKKKVWKNASLDLYILIYHIFNTDKNKHFFFSCFCCKKLKSFSTDQLKILIDLLGQVTTKQLFFILTEQISFRENNINKYVTTAGEKNYSNDDSKLKQINQNEKINTSSFSLMSKNSKSKIDLDIQSDDDIVSYVNRRDKFLHDVIQNYHPQIARSFSLKSRDSYESIAEAKIDPNVFDDIINVDKRDKFLHNVNWFRVSLHCAKIYLFYLHQLYHQKHCQDLFWLLQYFHNCLCSLMKMILQFEDDNSDIVIQN